MGKIRISYEYKVYEGCEQATKLSKKWEAFKATSWVIWFLIFGGGMLGAWAISQLVNNSFDATVIPQMLFFIATFLAGFVYVYYSKYIYPRCTELYLFSKMTQENENEIMHAVLAVKEKQKIEIKKAVVKFLAIYFVVFSMYVIFFVSA